MYIPAFVKEGTRGKITRNDRWMGTKDYPFEVKVVSKTPIDVKSLGFYILWFDEPNWYCNNRGGDNTIKEHEAILTKRKSGNYMFKGLSRLYARDKIEFYPDIPIKI
jgi:hypothetical protein